MSGHPLTISELFGEIRGQEWAATPLAMRLHMETAPQLTAIWRPYRLQLTSIWGHHAPVGARLRPSMPALWALTSSRLL